MGGEGKGKERRGKNGKGREGKGGRGREGGGDGEGRARALITQIPRSAPGKKQPI